MAVSSTDGHEVGPPAQVRRLRARCGTRFGDGCAGPVTRRRRAGGTSRRRDTAAACVYLLVSFAFPRAGLAQWLPSGPLTLAGGRLTVAGEASVSVATPDDHEYFNYANDAYSLLRLFRADASAVWRVGTRVSLLGDLRLQGALGEGGWQTRPFAAFVRIRPWPARALAIQAGLIPPVFGAFGRHRYGTDNPLVGVPLAYQYLTSLRPDALPATADDLLAEHGRGWRVRHPIGDTGADHGVPLVDGFRYPIGVEVSGARGPVVAAGAITAGSLSESSGRELAEGVHFSGRLAVQPLAGLIVGVSASRSGFVVRSLGGRLGGSPESGQRAVGFDTEYSRGHWLVRGEVIRTSWTIPRLEVPFIDRPLGALATHIEARYRVLPGFYVAARVERVGFSDVSATSGQRLPWEAAVRRAEIGGGYALARNLLAKVAYQFNSRDTAVPVSAGLLSAQVLVWF